MTGDGHVRICEGLGVKFPRAIQFNENTPLPPSALLPYILLDPAFSFPYTLPIKKQTLIKHP